MIIPITRSKFFSFCSVERWNMVRAIFIIFFYKFFWSKKRKGHFVLKTSTQRIKTLQVESGWFLEHVGPSHDDDDDLWLGPVNLVVFFKHLIGFFLTRKSVSMIIKPRINKMAPNFLYWFKISSDLDYQELSNKSL